MNKILIFTILLLCIFISCKLKYLINKESFDGYVPSTQKIMKIPDLNSVLPNEDGDNIAIFKNVKKYTNLELANKITKGIVFYKSEMKLTNLYDIEEYTLSFYIKVLNSVDNQIIISSLAKNKQNLWYIYIHKNKLYMYFKGTSKKFNTRITRNSMYQIIINFSANKLKVYLDGEIKIIDNAKDIEFSTNILIGGLKKENKLLNPVKAIIGDVNLYKKIIDPLTLSQNYGKCLFIPKGDSKAICANLCKNSSGCDEDYCNKVCEDCIDYNKCKWVSPPVVPEPEYPEPITPRPPKIKCYPGNKQIELRFKQIKEKNNGGTPIINYIIILKKTYNNGSFVKLINIDADTCDGTCVYNIRDLKNQTFYDILVKSVNNVGESDFSNLETVAPNGEIEAKEISSALLDTDEEIREKVLSDFNYNNYNKSCDAKTFINYDNHILDKIEKNTFEDFIKNEYIKNAKYTKAPGGCSKGLANIGTKVECKIASQKIGGKYNTDNPIKVIDHTETDHTNKPLGCYYDEKTNNLTFNEYGKGSHKRLIVLQNSTTNKYLILKTNKTFEWGNDIDSATNIELIKYENYVILKLNNKFIISKTATSSLKQSRDIDNIQNNMNQLRISDPNKTEQEIMNDALARIANTITKNEKLYLVQNNDKSVSFTHVYFNDLREVITEYLTINNSISWNKANTDNSKFNLIDINISLCKIK